MLTYTIRRLLVAIPTLLFIALVIFLLLELAPGDPMANVPLTVPPEVKEAMREALGLGEPIHIRFWKWIVQFFWVEPLHLIDQHVRHRHGRGPAAHHQLADPLPVMDIVVQRMPADPVGGGHVLCRRRADRAADRHLSRPTGSIRCSTRSAPSSRMIGFSVPPFFTGVLVIVIFSVQLGWFPSIYDTTLVVNDWDSFVRAAQADDHAGDGAGAAEHRPDQPLHARLDAGQPQPGLRAHRPRQGHDANRSWCWSTCCATR